MNRLRSTMRFLRFVAASLIWLLIVVGVALRLTVRDRYYPIGLVFYMTPVPSLLLLFLAATLLAPGRRPKTAGADTSPGHEVRLFRHRTSLMIGTIFLIWTACSQLRYHPSVSQTGATKILFWNVSHVQMGIPRLGAAIRTHEARIVGLVESDRANRTVAEDWAKELTGYEVAHSDFGALVAVKGRVVSQRFHSLTSGSYCEQFDVVVDDAELTILLVDVASNPLRSRATAISSLTSVANSLSDRPLIIMGDFNTPDDSIWFDSLRQGFQNAFRAKGSGYVATWPMPTPVLTLDQVWTNDRLGVSRCWHGLSTLSDHRPVLVETVVPANK